VAVDGFSFSMGFLREKTTPLMCLSFLSELIITPFKPKHVGGVHYQ